MSYSRAGKVSDSHLHPRSLAQVWHPVGIRCLSSRSELIDCWDKKELRMTDALQA